MKNTPKKMIIAGVIATVVLASSISTYAAINDTDLKNYILEQIQLEETLTQGELKEIELDLEGINQKDIIEELKEEIANLDNKALRDELLQKVTPLENIQAIEEFFTKTEEIYEVLDEHYEAFEDEDDYLPYKEDRKEILVGLNEELNYVDEQGLKDQITASIQTLEATQGEDGFYDALDLEYEKIDELYNTHYSDEDFEIEDFDFEDMKEDVLEGIKKEIDFIKDGDLQKKLKAYLPELEAIEDENEFFNKIDAIYGDKELEDYYMKNGIKVFGEGDFEGFDLEDEKEFILEGLDIEIKGITDKKLQEELWIELKELKVEKKEANFFDMIDNIHKKLETFHGVDGTLIEEDGVYFEEGEGSFEGIKLFDSNENDVSSESETNRSNY